MENSDNQRCFGAASIIKSREQKLKHEYKKV